MIARRTIARVMLAIALATHVSGQSSSLAPSQADLDWMSQHYPQMLDDLLPLKSDVFVSYRAHRDQYTDVPEYSFLIWREPSKNGYGRKQFLSAQIRMADGASIYDQMMKMHRADGSETPQTMRAKIKIKSQQLTEQACPAIQARFAELHKLKFKVPEVDTTVLHPLIHEFHIGGGAGRMQLEIHTSDHALVEWAVGTRKALDACIAAGKAN